MDTNSTATKPLEDLTTREIGIIGENLANLFIESKGFELLERNWKCNFGEADLIVKDGSEVAFVEVKTRLCLDEDSDIMPELAITPKKIERYKRLMSVYAQDHPSVERMRFDAMGISLETSNIAHVHYVKDISLGDN